MARCHLLELELPAGFPEGIGNTDQKEVFHQAVWTLLGHSVFM